MIRVSVWKTHGHILCFVFFCSAVLSAGTGTNGMCLFFYAVRLTVWGGWKAHGFFCGGDGGTKRTDNMLPHALYTRRLKSTAYRNNPRAPILKSYWMSMLF